MRTAISFCTFIVACTLIHACNSRDSKNEEKFQKDSTISSTDTNHQFGTVQSLSAYPNSIFVPTLENSILPDKNVIYAPTILFCWDTIRHLLKYPIQLSSTSSEDLQLVNNSKSFINALPKEGFTASAQLKGSVLEARSFFHKDLPFYIPFDTLLNGLEFNHKKVRAFGVDENGRKGEHQVTVFQYVDDDHFIIGLDPKDEEQMIILAKGFNLGNTLVGPVREILDIVASGIKKREANHYDPSSYFTGSDNLKIPMIKFNLDEDVGSLESQTITSNNKEYFTERVYQRIAFLLNQNGGAVESEAIFSKAIALGDDVPPKPRNFIFDKPYTIILKNRTSDWPYFVMQVNNAELLMKK